MEIYVHDLKFEEKDEWSKSFNKCSELYAKATDQSISEDERKKYEKEFIQRRIALEMGFG